MNNSVSSTQAQHYFRVNPLALWRQVSPVWVGTATAIAAYNWLSGIPLTWPLVLRPSLAVAAVVALLYLCRPVKVTSHGIVALNRLGLPHLVPWQDVVEVGFGRRHPLEPGFRIKAADGRILFIPRSTMNLRMLQRLAAQFGGPAHPLAIVLETPLCDAP